MYRSMITQTALATFEKGLNKLIMMDASAIEQTAALEGKTIALYSTLPNYHFVIIPTAEGVFLTHANDFSVDAEITAPATTLLQLLLTRKKEVFLRNTDLTMAGDTQLIYQFFKILDNLNPDWEHELSQWFNPALLGLVKQTILTGNQQIKQHFSFMQSQFNQFFNHQTTRTPNKEQQTPFTLLLDSLEKRFKKS